MIKKIALGFAAIVTVILVYATFQPDSFRVERSITINAPPETIYPHLVDFHKWNTWSPWEQLDTAMTRTYGGAPSGVGATYAWNGNSDVGSGTMEIVRATPPTDVDINLTFTEPFEAHNLTTYRLVPVGNATRATWMMEGPSNYMTKLMGVFVSMDKMVGKDFEHGLARLKAVAEQRL